MHAISKYADADVPIGQLGLKHCIYRHLGDLGVRVIGDLIGLPEEVLEPYVAQLLGGIEQVKRRHKPPEIGGLNDRT